MVSDVSIVGCGTVGATLAIRLSEKKLVSSLRLYDFDTVSEGPDYHIYPFTVHELGESKVDVLSFICKKLNPQLNVEIFHEKITTPLKDRPFVIDCRDCKCPAINANVKLSLDGYRLYIDSMPDSVDIENYTNYTYSKKIEITTKAIDVVVDYLEKEEYRFEILKLYDLLSNNSYVITVNKEDLDGSDS